MASAGRRSPLGPRGTFSSFQSGDNVIAGQALTHESDKELSAFLSLFLASGAEAGFEIRIMPYLKTECFAPKNLTYV